MGALLFIALYQIWTGALLAPLYAPFKLAEDVATLDNLESFIGQTVEIEGWYRRGLTPYLEMSHLRADDGTSEHTYSRWVQSALAVAAIVVGWLWL